MVDAVNIMRQMIIAGDSSAVVFGGTLPEEHNPNDSGVAIVLTRAGGDSHSEILPLNSARIMVRVWAGDDNAAYEEAAIAYGSVRDILHGQTKVDFGADGHVIKCLEIVSGQDLTDPDTGWASVIAFYQLETRPN